MGNTPDDMLDAECALSMLPAPTRRIFTLKGHGYRYREIAERMGTTESAIKMQVLRYGVRLNGTHRACRWSEAVPYIGWQPTVPDMLTLTEKVLFALAAIFSAYGSWLGLAKVYRTIRRGSGTPLQINPGRVLAAAGSWLTMRPLWKMRRRARTPSPR